MLRDNLMSNTDQKTTRSRVSSIVALDPQRKVRTGVTAVILAGGRDCGQCDLVTKLPPAMWPVLEQSAIMRMLDHLASQGINRAVMCCNGHEPLFRRALGTSRDVELSFSREHLPSGTAGCIRDAARISPDNVFIVMSAQSIFLSDIRGLIDMHTGWRAALTVLFARDSADNSAFNSGAQAYICDRTVVKHITPKGYCDIKENLVPSLLREGRRVMAADLSSPALSFRDRREYLRTMGRYLANDTQNLAERYRTEPGLGPEVFVSPDATVHPSVRCMGHVVILGGSAIARNVVLVGPVVVGRNVHIHDGAFIENSMLWDNCRIGGGAAVINCVVDSGVSVSDAATAMDKAMLSR
jgi:NDP-sugar pyrophosphorylase family protein